MDHYVDPHVDKYGPLYGPNAVLDFIKEAIDMQYAIHERYVSLSLLDGLANDILYDCTRPISEHANEKALKERAMESMQTLLRASHTATEWYGAGSVYNVVAVYTTLLAVRQNLGHMKKSLNFLITTISQVKNFVQDAQWGPVFWALGHEVLELIYNQADINDDVRDLALNNLEPFRFVPIDDVTKFNAVPTVPIQLYVAPQWERCYYISTQGLWIPRGSTFKFKVGDKWIATHNAPVTKDAYGNNYIE